MKLWENGVACTERHTLPCRAKIRHMPSCGIASNATGELVSFGLVDPSGFLNHFWTDPIHRRKGLAQAIGVELCKKCIR